MNVTDATALPISQKTDIPMADTGLIAIDKVANKIRFYDPATLREIKAIDGPEPCVHELTLSWDRTAAFVPLYGDGIYGSNKRPNNKVLVIDLAAKSIRDMIDLGEYVAPHGMVATKDGKLWVVCDIPSKLLCIDPARRSIDEVFDVPARGPHVVEKLPDESRLYLSAKEGDLLAFDLGGHAFTAAIPMRGEGISTGNGSGSEGLAPTPDGKRVLVIDNNRSDIHVIDTASNREINRVPLLPYVFTNAKRSRLAKIAFSRDGHHVVATSYATGLAWLMPASDLRAQTVIPLAKGPMGIAFPSDRTTALISSHDSGIITEINLSRGQVLGAYDGGTGIEVMAFF